ncbi:pseudouridine synthase [Agaribacter marinus]|uniref:Dual-specificity RNA pseudouridine synthase RluA n=1 Tax=Agaribacter marinus TaxID=1431249 RepID=A0AA37T055_9ALTE|nr:pseudouridine synthase [Agaribacter marinus]GLR72397.1 pseudouridine synthase [Agaribacter marinus]
MALLEYKPPQFPYLEFLYRDDDIAVMLKPSGLLSVPGKALEHRDSLQSRLARVLPTTTIVHRLDMATSGIMIVALNKPAHRHISKQFELRQVNKTYYALIKDAPTQISGTIELPLICDWPNRPKQMVDLERGKPAKTHYDLIESYDGYSLVRLKPVTGRSHQLRVHMLSLGHAILGDRLYACAEGIKMANRLCLHASFIEFVHPNTNERLRFESTPDFSFVTKR